MREFSELIYNCTNYTLNSLNKTNDKITEELQHSAATPLVKGLQMIRLQKVIVTTGIFSIFEAELQRELDCRDGFKKVLKILKDSEENELKNKFNNYLLAINVLKHGKGKSYDALIEKKEALPFEILYPGRDCFCEGDVSEVSSLISVDDEFILNCASIISEISAFILRKRT